MKLKSLVLAGLLAIPSFNVFGQALGCDNPPVASVVPLNHFAIEGDTVTFTADIVGGVPPYSMYWADLEGGFYGTNQTMTLPDVQPENEGLYFVMVVDSVGCSSLTAGKLFVLPSSPGRGQKNGHTKQLLRE